MGGAALPCAPRRPLPVPLAAELTTRCVCSGQYDTREEALNRRTVFHTAIVDPNSPHDAHPRFTIDLRFQAVYGREEDKAGRVRRWLDGITSVYPDGSESDWFQGPIEGYKPPDHAAL